ncbi:hypothetical protein O3P69_008596 [Scylla paramamosain]|uniref:Uncharacterized protein n=1 Tax=Scylla paramamosain TaxID=85552 RepID=A0AAW0SMN4_SCYPA
MSSSRNITTVRKDSKVKKNTTVNFSGDPRGAISKPDSSFITAAHTSYSNLHQSPSHPTSAPCVSSKDPSCCTLHLQKRQSKTRHACTTTAKPRIRRSSITRGTHRPLMTARETPRLRPGEDSVARPPRVTQHQPPQMPFLASVRPDFSPQRVTRLTLLMMRQATLDDISLLPHDLDGSMLTFVMRRPQTLRPVTF